MITKERIGGSMEKTVEKVVISPEGIDVISISNGVNNVTQLSIEDQVNDPQSIFQKYNMETVILYPYDKNIVQALSENEEQLKDYLETCRRASYPMKKVDVPETIPEIEYDLRKLKEGFQEVNDEDLRKMKQIEMYKRAKEVQKMLIGKATLKIGILDRAYFSVQELLQSRHTKSNKLLLNPGSTESRANLRTRLYNPEFTKRVDEISKQHELATEQNEPVATNEKVQENEELVK